YVQDERPGRGGAEGQGKAPACLRGAPRMKRLAILGSTGSIGVNGLDVAAHLGLPVTGLAAGANRKVCRQQIDRLKHTKAPLAVDSEHSAIFQSMRSGSQQEVKRIFLTASGGPFRETPKSAFGSITVEQALKHPTWNMGGKITIDSATMFNKALEIVEARW